MRTSRLFSGKRRQASLIVTVALVAGGLATAELVSKAVASAPPTPRAPVLLWSDNFENFPQPSGGPNGIQPMALNYGGVKYVGATGTTYTGDSQWLNVTGCNGIVLSQQAASAPWPDPNGCENDSGSLDLLRDMARAVGSVNGTGPNTNHIVAAYTNRGFNTPGIEAQTEQPVVFTAVPANRYLTASVWATAVNCNFAPPLLTFEYSTDGTTWSQFGTGSIDPCALPNAVNTTTYPGVNVANAFANAGTLLAVSSSQLYLRVSNVQIPDNGNDGGWDDLALYEATPALSKEFNPTSLDKSANPNAFSTLTFTVTNTTDKSAKAGWEFTDTLPSGLSIASGTTGGTCTPVTVTDGTGGALGSGDTSVKVVGTIGYSVASCTVTVQVTGTANGTYTNVLDQAGTNNLTNVKGLLPESSASLTITGVTAAPVAVDDSYTTPYQTPKTVPAPGAMTNDTGTQITVTNNTQPPNGAVTMNLDGSFTYTPNPGFTGQDCWDYTITDSSARTDTAQVCVTVSPPAPAPAPAGGGGGGAAPAAPAAPKAVDDVASTPLNTPVTVNAAANDTYPAGSVFSQVSSPANGSVAWNPNGTYTYTPRTGFTGVDSFTYQVCLAAPNSTTCASARDTIVVGPLAVNDSATTQMETPVTVNAAANDTYPAGSVFSQISRPANGTVSWNPNGTYTYTPRPGFTGVDSFTYRVCMPAPYQDRCSQATEFITVGEPMPKATPQTQKIGAGSTRPVMYGPVGLSRPAAGSNLRPGSVAIAQAGTGKWANRVVVPGKGTWILTGTQVRFEPAAGFTGQTTIRYRIQDRNGAWAYSTLTAVAPAIPTVITGGW